MTTPTSDRSPEEKTADALLERSQPFVLGDKTYELAPPTLATLILVSEELAKLPSELFDFDEKTDSPVVIPLRTARHAHGLSRALARIIVGARPKLSPWQRVQRVAHSICPWLVSAPDVVERLAIEIERSTSIQALALSFVGLTHRLEVHDFFSFTTFLSALRVTKPTRRVETKATAPGRS